MPSVAIGGYMTNLSWGWYKVSIPLSALGGADTTITRVVIQENAGSAQPKFFIDNLVLADNS